MKINIAVIVFVLIFLINPAESNVTSVIVQPPPTQQVAAVGDGLVGTSTVNGNEAFLADHDNEIYFQKFTSTDGGTISYMHVYFLDDPDDTDGHARMAIYDASYNKLAQTAEFNCAGDNQWTHAALESSIVISAATTYYLALVADTYYETGTDSTTDFPEIREDTDGSDGPGGTYSMPSTLVDDRQEDNNEAMSIYADNNAT